MFKSFFNQNKENQFWKWFTQNENDLYDFEEKEEEVYARLSDKLQVVHESLVFAIGPKEENGVRRFTISADGIKEAFPSVINLVEQAPDFTNWRICAFRQRLEEDDLEIQFDDAVTIGYSDIFFKYAVEENKVGLILQIRNFDETDVALKNAVFILLDSLIGEYAAETKITWIEWGDLNEDEIDELFPFVDLRNIVDSIVD